MRTLYKICSATLWREAERAGEFLGSEVDQRDNFIHFSAAAQVAETAAKHFAGQSDLLLISVDAERLGDALKWDPPRGRALFPHPSAALTPEAVIRANLLPLGPDGRHIFPPLAD